MSERSEWNAHPWSVEWNGEPHTLHILPHADKPHAAAVFVRGGAGGLPVLPEPRRRPFLSRVGGAVAGRTSVAGLYEWTRDADYGRVDAVLVSLRLVAEALRALGGECEVRTFGRESLTLEGDGWLVHIMGRAYWLLDTTEHFDSARELPLLAATNEQETA